MVDTTIHGFTGMFLFGFAFYAIAPLSADRFFAALSGPGGLLIDLVITCFIAAIVGGFVVGSTGSSIGKAIFGIKVLDQRQRTIGIANGIARDLRVLVQGSALGIPLIALFTMFAQFKRLTATGYTSWDQDKYIVLYRPPSAFQTAMNVLGTLLVILVIALNRALATAQ